MRHTGAGPRTRFRPPCSQAEGCPCRPQIAEPPGSAHRPAARADGAHAALATLRHAVTKRSCHSGWDAGTKDARSADMLGSDTRTTLCGDLHITGPFVGAPIDHRSARGKDHASALQTLAAISPRAPK